MTTYKGFTVLEVDPNHATDPSEELERSASILDSATGKIVSYDHGPAPIGAIGFAWFMETRPKITEFRDFIAARRGRAVPFWAPTWRPDLPLANAIGSGSANMTIRTIGYSTFLFASLARRYVVFLLRDGTKVYRKIIGAVDNANGTESLTLDSAPGVAIPVSTMVSFLLFCRLAEDDVVIEWTTPQVAEAQLVFTELPNEVPT